VADDGVGISPADQERIFESFQQGDRMMSAQEGTGLGLTLSRRIVELHGGRLWVESEPGRGSTFRFTLAVHESTRLPLTPGPGGGGPSVLLVEDDRRSSDLMAILLADQGFRVVSAASGEEALDALGREVPSAVVLDIRLPGIDGWEVLRHIKGEAGLAHLPVIVVSILDERGRGYALGADDYLVKPVARDLLVDSLRRAGLGPDRGGRLVWVVDRDPRTRSALAGDLRTGGWAVLTSASVSEGLTEARLRVPRVVLVDLASTADDGYAGVRVLHDDDVLGAVPVVALVPDDDGTDWQHLARQLSIAATAGSSAVAELLAVLDRVAAPLAGERS
jgi:DNA-binding response OmpR family regulator